MNCIIYTPEPWKAAAEQGAPNNGKTRKTRLMWVEVPEDATQRAGIVERCSKMHFDSFQSQRAACDNDHLVVHKRSCHPDASGRGLKLVRREVSPAARASPQKGRPSAGPVDHSTGRGRAANKPTLGSDGKSRRRGQTAQVSRKKKAGAQAKEQLNLTIRAQEGCSEQVHYFEATPDTELNSLFVFAMDLRQYGAGFLLTVRRTGAQYTEDCNQSLGELDIEDGDVVQISAA